MLDRVGPGTHGPLQGLMVGRMHSDRHTALTSDAQRSLQFLPEKHHSGHDVVTGAHDPAGGDQLDLVHAMLDLLAHGLHHSLWSTAAHHQPAGRPAAGAVAGTGPQAMAATKQPWPYIFPSNKGLAPGHIGPIGDAHDPHGGHSHLEGFHGTPAVTVDGLGRLWR